MAPYNILSIGRHPNIAFYNWRLNASNNVSLTTIVSTAVLDPSNQPPISNKSSISYNWSSSQFGNNRYTLDNVYANIDDYSNLTSSSSSLIDFIFLSATSLQELSTICASLNPILKNQLSNHNVPTIIIESTNFVNLEPFVKMSLQLDDQIPILSIMSDFDIREVGNNNYLVYKSKKESELVYVGKSGRESSYNSQEIGLINKIADLFEDSNIDVYKLNTPLEFLSYQWKFALPKVTVEPLSIIFEKPFPSDLQNQILAKPLISGLIFEIITVIKTMGCKLFNSYDNEESLLERLSQLYPPVDLSPDAAEAPKLYYDFFNQNQPYLDLLLLQPILIADDYHVKTPYLEFLYAVMSQYNSNNFSTLNNSTSIFWLRKNSENIKQLKLQQDELAIQNSIREKEIKKANQNLSNKTPPRGNLNNFTPLNRSSTDPAIDPEMVELSDMVNSYGIADKTPPPLNSNKSFSRSASSNNLQPAFNNNNNMNINQQQQQQQQQQPGNSSPNFMPQQNIPHGLPPQGLPPNQQIFNSPPQQLGNAGVGGHPSRRSHLNAPNGYPPQNGYPQYPQQNGYPPQQQQGYPLPPQQGYPPQNGYPQYSQQNYPPPMNQYNSRDDASYISGRGSYMNGSTPNFDTSFGSMTNLNSMNNGMNNGMNNRGFKPTSRKSSRKSTAVMTNSIVGGFPDSNNALNRSMNQRHSMAPQLSNSNLRGSNNNLQNLKKPQNFSSNNLNNFTPPNSNSTNNSGDGLSNGSNGSLPPAKTNIDLVPVPEATPAPTPAYIPTQESKNDKQKKKRGFLGLGKKK